MFAINHKIYYDFSMRINLKKLASFGVAGNFTGHLEQAGEDKDFIAITTAEENAPKALFPTYFPLKKMNAIIPDFLKIFPFSSRQIIFPKDEEKLQIEPECAVIFDVIWNNNLVEKLLPVCFTASNDCSIRKEGAKKISLKKNWGKCSKGISKQFIALDSFSKGSILDDYRISCFLVRENEVFEYGEESAIKNYSYIYDKLSSWIIDKLNFQEDFGPAENVNRYLNSIDNPQRILVSIGATRYTDFGQKNYLNKGDEAVVFIYPECKYRYDDIKKAALNARKLSGCSILRQKIK